MVVYPYKRIPRDIATSIPESWGIGGSDSGWMDPQPAEKWEGTLDASENKQLLCFQQSNMFQIPDLSDVENEDCLYLNVYTPLEPSNDTLLPVMFYIYGGGFVNGAADFDFYGPHYLMENGVIVVTANYRVGPFGFLTTGDMVIPGNFGLKDQLLALQWVKNNIRYFGGDPEKVTIFGQSAGAASVAFHLMSKKSTGLFRAAIAESGSVLSPWAYQRDFKKYAYDLGSLINPDFDKASDSKALLDFLRNASAEKVNEAACTFQQHTGNEQMVHGFWFTPVIEPDHEAAFITEYMYSAIENGHMNRVPLIIGICSEEAIARASVANFKSSVVAYEYDVSKLVNKNMHLNDEEQKKAAGEAIRKIYTDGLLQDDLGKAVRYFSDMTFNRGVIRHAEMQSKYSDVYFYQFSYHGTIGGNSHILKVHTGDRYRALFTNFAKFLNPTPEKSTLFENIIWPKVEPDNFQYLDINETLAVKTNPKGDVYPKWVDVYEKMAVKPFDTY
ncbi:hypothetical protein JTB14_030713 [Gonioctena quinquepunctata]|nr:hypothetical protein JTB14_030713 [Gonioctena quinquepunctata]